MGQKVNPIGLRLGINRTWDSRWFAGKAEYGTLLHEDIKIREELMKQLKQAAVSKIIIERPHKKCRVTVQSARPGVVIGKKGADIEKLRKKVTKLTKSDVVINIVEIRKPELDAQLVAESIAQQYTAASNSKNVDQYLSLFAPDAITMDYGVNYGPFYVRDITDDIHVYYSSKYFQYQVNSSFVSSDGRFAALEGIYTDWIHGGNQTASVPCLVIIEMKDGKIIKESIYYNSAPLFN